MNIGVKVDTSRRPAIEAPAQSRAFLRRGWDFDFSSALHYNAMHKEVPNG